MEDLRCVNLRELLDTGLKKLYGLWDEIGYNPATQRDRSLTVEEHFKSLLDRMIQEENGRKERILDSLGGSMKECVKLSKKLGVRYEEPDSNQTLIMLEHSLLREAKRLKKVKDARMAELVSLRRSDEELCWRLGMDRYCVSRSVPSSNQMEVSHGNGPRLRLQEVADNSDSIS